MKITDGSQFFVFSLRIKGILLVKIQTFTGGDLLMWLLLFLAVCAGIAVFLLIPGIKALKESRSTVDKMKNTGDMITARMNDVKAQQELLQEKKDYLRYDWHQKMNSFTAVKRAFSNCKETIQRIKN
jgi:uncharacterized protein YoxC